MEHKLRLLVIGLDGATFDIVRPMVARGELPVLAGLMQNGACGPLRSTIPPVSAPAWSTFMTGLNPGKHGIFQWRTYDPTRYTCLDERLMTSAGLQGRTFWDVLGQAGYRVAAITVPMTYPAWPVNGFLLSGYPCPDGQLNYTSPQEWAGQLSESYNFDADYYLHAPPATIAREGLRMLERRTSLMCDLIRNKGIDVGVVVLGEIDRAQHDFWKYTDPAFPAYHTPEGEQYRGVIEEHYRVSDTQVGRLLERAGEDAVVMIMSDHGGGSHPLHCFQTNSWLQQMGWLRPAAAARSRLNSTLGSAVRAIRAHLPFEERLRRILPAQIVNGARRLNMNIASINWSGTRAYRFPMYHPAEGIELNVVGRQPEGIVRPGAEYERLREEIIAALLNVRDPESGMPVVRAVFRAEELYNGPYLRIAPDIVFLTHDAFKADSELVPDIVTPAPAPALERYSGLHTMDGILIAAGTGVRRGYSVSDMSIADVAPTVLYALGEAIPEDMDGQPRTDLFADARGPVQYGPALGGSSAETQGPSADEEEQMRDKLRGLGYI